MAKDQRNVEAITPMEEDFTKWYTDICLKAELVDYASVKGFLILRPYGYAIWENIQKYMDTEFKKTGHVNVAMPVLIPESLLKKEGELVEGFAPEVAWVTHGGSEPLEERLAFRPTSETMFCDHWAHVLHSYRELPMLYNQWCSVIRWEKTTRPFLRSREFWWQEGHTIHETAAEAEAETQQQLNCYADTCEQDLAIPVVKGRKTDKEKFAGAEATYTIEAMMKDGKALQSGTSHYFGDKFSKAYDVTFTGRDNQLHHPFQTSWGVSTRLVGAIIMTHGDDDGLILPPAIAPIQVVVVPIAAHKPGVSEKAAELAEKISKYARVKLDDSDNAPGWKFAQWEMKGVPVRLEGGPVTITDRRIIRYFMTIPEAAQLVLTSGAFAKNGELFVLDMGKPVHILELAENMIRLSGFEPYKDIDIVETGLRPGEKLYEELLVRTEDLGKTENDQIFIERDKKLAPEEIDRKLAILSRAVATEDDALCRQALKETVETFREPEEVNQNAEEAKEMQEVQA